MGVQLEVNQVAENIGNEITDYINEYNKLLNSGKQFSPTFVYNNTIINLINKINIIFTYQKTKQFKINGTFLSHKTKLTNNKYDITINFNLENDLKQNNLKIKIKSVIAHELNHAFVYIKKINKHSKSQTYNKSIKQISFYTNNPILKEFNKMFYLTLDEEVQARVQETKIVLQNLPKTNYKETLENLLAYQPINDARKMINYKTDKILTLDKNILKQFVLDFNKSANTNFKLNSFFPYWENKINLGGKKLFIKISKLVADKYNVNDEDILTEDIEFAKLFFDDILN